jgi:hypothetical protein
MLAGIPVQRAAAWLRAARTNANLEIDRAHDVVV